MNRSSPDEIYDVAVIGSGFGGLMCALPLVEAGLRVLLIERGAWVARGPENWTAGGSALRGPHYDVSEPYRLPGGRVWGQLGAVGGQSVFYGAVSLRFHEEDFERWPFPASELEPWYARAESLLGVSLSPELSPVSERIGRAGLELGLSPFRLPLAIRWPACVRCSTCDTYPCAAEAKNDLASAVLPELLRRGLVLASGLDVRRLVVENRRISELEAADRRTGVVSRVRARRFVLAAGALGSARLALGSGLDRLSPGGVVVGRCLMRHCIATVFGLFPRRLEGHARFHKQLGFDDFYRFGHLQQVMTPSPGQLLSFLPERLARLLIPWTAHLTGLIAIAEDEPRPENRVALEGRSARIEHEFSARDLASRRELVKQAKRILRRAGAWLCGVYENSAYCHALGTLRMGTDPETSVVDEGGLFRGVDNLFVADGAVFPSSAGVNPSLTIAANALRLGDRLSRG